MHARTDSIGSHSMQPWELDTGLCVCVGGEEEGGGGGGGGQFWVPQLSREPSTRCDLLLHLQLHDQQVTPGAHPASNLGFHAVPGSAACTIMDAECTTFI